MATKVDMNDPNVKRLVYNMYRGMLGTYNDKANVIVDSVPKKAVIEDRGISRQIESMLRQSSQISGGGSPSPGIISDGGPVNAAPSYAAPPPPPPPGSGPGTLPTVRLSTEIADSSRVKEPPAAVMNAMMSKDKKPFTYTPGGLDLSQIRSPRMQRRITRNAAAEGVAEQPAKAPSSLTPTPATPSMQPQIAVPVFPPPPPPPPQQGMAMNNNRGGAPMPPPPPSSTMEGGMKPPPPSQLGSTIGGHIAGHPPIVIPKNPVLRPTGLRTDKVEQESYSQQQDQHREPGTVFVPRQAASDVTPQQFGRQQNSHPDANNYVQQRPSDTQQNYVQQRPSPPPQNYAQPSYAPQRPAEPQPNYAQHQPPPGSVYIPPVTSRAQLGSLYIPPVVPAAAPAPSGDAGQRQQTTPQTPQTGSPVQLNKAPTPWMSQQKVAPLVPAWAAREEAASPGTRIIPIQIEGKSPPSPPQQQQQQQYQQQQQQQQYQPQQQYQQQQQPRQTQQQQPQQPGTRIIPIQVEGAASPTPPQQQQQQQQQQHRQQRTVQPVYVHNKFNPQTPPTPAAQPAQQYTTQQPEYNPSDPRTLQQQMSWSGAPIQSRSFKMLQKITDTDKPEDEDEVAQEYPAAPGNHWGQQQANQHQPQQHHPQQQQQQQWAPQQGGQDYGGPQWGPQNTQGVPASQLRKLQLNDDDRALMNKFKAQVSENNATNEEENPRYRGGHIPSRVFKMLDQSVPRGPTPVQQRSHQAQAEAPAQPYIPASEQQVQEPRKYTGGAIPSRSFRMLQAMTAPENCGGDQSDM